MKNILFSKKNYLFYLIMILFLGFFLRVYKLGSIPVSLNPDEVALGYNAYSLLKTGLDEHGVLLPFSLQSFGDWKLSGYSYVDILPIAIFGLTEFAVRFPSAVFGTIGILLIYHISFLLFKKKEIALLSALLFALSPWSIYFSRAAYEVNVATTFFLGGLFFLLKHVYDKKKNTKLFLLASLLFSLTIFTYHAFVIFTPIFIIGLLIIFRKDLKRDYLAYFSVVLFASSILLSYLLVSQGGMNKISTLAIINDPNIIYGRVDRLRGDTSNENLFLKKILHTKYLGAPYHIAQNYISSFSPSFLFDEGGQKLQHNLGMFGNLYLFDALLIFIGFAALFWNKEKAIYLLLLWLFIGPIPSSITKDSPNSTRLFVLMPIFILASSYGAYHILKYVAKKSFKRYAIGIVSVLLFFLNIAFFLDIYFVHMNAQRARFWHYGYKEAVLLSQKYPTNNTIMRGPENFPYIYFLFYEKYDPNNFRKEVKYYPPTNEGFYFVKSFGKYEFVENIDYIHEQKNTLYIDDVLDNKDLKKKFIYLPSGEPILAYYIIK